MHSRFFLSVAAVIMLGSIASAAEDDQQWSRWRGPLGQGHALESAPTTWGPQDVKWKAGIPGWGQSSPVVWGDKVFVTSALDDGRKRVVLCYNKADGKLLWQQTAWTGDNPEPLHRMNSWATPCCATDGTRVVAFFGIGGLHCYSMDGDPIWNLDLGKFVGPWGVAASPVILDNMVIQNCDADEDAYIIAVDKFTGETIWKTKRPNKRGWSTPILIDTGERQELVTNGDEGVQAYNPKTGEDLWYCKSFNGRGSPTVAWAHGLLYVVNGKPGDVYAVKPGGSGDVTKTHMAWHSKRVGGRDLPSPIVVGDYLFIVSMSGIASNYDAKSGKLLESIRLGDNISASPIAVDGKILLPGESGKTFVISPGPQLQVLEVNELNPAEGEIFRSSLAPVGGQMFHRSSNALYCIGKDGKS